MSIENGVHQNDLQDYHQITLQNTDTSLDPQHNPGTLEQHSVLDKNSCGFEGSVDSATEGEKLPSAVQKRNTFKNRSVSNSESSSFPRGILKDTNKNRLRSFSESCAENYESTHYVDSNPVLDEWPYDEEQDGDDNDCDKVKKTVRFNDTVRKQLFRSTSSILGQRKKNQRKSQRKAKKTRKEDSHQLSSSCDSDHIEVDKTYNTQCVTNSLKQIALTEDSGVDLEDSDPSSLTVSLENRPKKTKKQKSKNNRHRNNSVPPLGCNDLMFPLDL